MKLLSKTLSLLAIALLALTFTQCKNNQQKLEQAVKEFNKSCPMEMGGIIRLDKAEALPDNTMKMYATLFDNDGTYSTETTAEMIRKSVGAQMVRGMATSPEMKDLKDMSATLILSMKTDKGYQIQDIVVTAEEYNNFQSQADKGNTGVIAELQTSVDALKGMLPYTDPTSGVTIQDVYIENGNTMVTECTLPESATENINEDRDSMVSSLQNSARQYVSTNQAVALLVKQGAAIKYIYKMHNGEVLTEILMTKDDL